MIISCGSPFLNGPTHPQLTILFTPLQHMSHAAAIATRYRFDEGPIRDYKLQIPGKNGSYAVMLPKMSDQDPVADLVAARGCALRSIFLIRRTSCSTSTSSAPPTR